MKNEFANNSNAINGKRPMPIAYGAGRQGEKIQDQFTTAPIKAGDCANVLPEFGDHQAVRQIFGIKRGLLYVLNSKGLVKSISLRRPGQKFSKRLWHLESVRKYLNSLMEQQNPDDNGDVDGDE